jgi:hypothetical protein
MELLINKKSPTNIVGQLTHRNEKLDKTNVWKFFGKTKKKV